MQKKPGFPISDCVKQVLQKKPGSIPVFGRAKD